MPGRKDLFHGSGGNCDGVPPVDTIVGRESCVPRYSYTIVFLLISKQGMSTCNQVFDGLRVYRPPISRRNARLGPATFRPGQPTRAEKASQAQRRCQKSCVTTRWRTDACQALFSLACTKAACRHENSRLFWLDLLRVFLGEGGGGGFPFGVARVHLYAFQRSRVWLPVLLCLSSDHSMREGAAWASGFGPAPGATDLARLCVNVSWELAFTSPPRPSQG